MIRQWRRRTILAVACLGPAMAACGGGSVSYSTANLKSVDSLPADSLERLRGTRIFFGHQSVGGNIMRGVADLQQSHDRLGLTLVEADTAPAAAPFFAHAQIGQNGDPAGKTDAFVKLFDERLRGRVDVAFHKYCYADISAATDVAALFEHYKSAMARLRAEQPGTRFVHVTVPLMQIQGGLKGRVKRLIGRMPDHYTDNQARERFNALMRREYSKEELFDLAAVESTYPDGEREAIPFGGSTAYSLVPSYNSDGAHLNQRGRHVVAEQLLAFLADVVSKPARTSQGTR